MISEGRRDKHEHNPEPEKFNPWAENYPGEHNVAIIEKPEPATKEEITEEIRLLNDHIDGIRNSGDRTPADARDLETSEERLSYFRNKLKRLQER